MPAKAPSSIWPLYSALLTPALPNRAHELGYVFGVVFGLAHGADTGDLGGDGGAGGI